METKICSKCKIELSVNDFGKDKTSKNGLKSACKECNNRQARKHCVDDKENVTNLRKLNYVNNKERIDGQMKKYRDDNKEAIAIYQKQYNQINKEAVYKRVKQYQKNNKNHIAERSKQYRKENKDAIVERMTAYNKDNSERIQERSKRYYKDNKEHSLEQSKRRYEKNKEHIIERIKKYRNENRGKINIWLHKRRSEKRSLPATFTAEQWEITKQYFNNLCCYCGEKLPLQQEHWIPSSGGGGYTRENVIPACKHCNCSKNGRDFFLWFKKYEFYSEEREMKILEYLKVE